MDRPGSERPEGERTTPGAHATPWSIISRLVLVVVVAQGVLYILEAAPTPAVRIPADIALVLLALVALVFSLEAIAIRAFPTLWLGGLVVAAWVVLAVSGAGLSPLVRLAGLAGLALFAVTPRAKLDEMQRDRAAMFAAHPRYATWHARAKVAAGWLLGACLAAIAIAGVYGVLSSR